MRGRGRHVGEAMRRQAGQQPLGVEAAAVRAHRQAQRQRRQRAMPQAVAPGWRRRAEEALARAQSGAIERRHHQRHQRLVRVPDRFGQLARRARGVLEHRQIGRLRLARIARGKRLEHLGECAAVDLHARVARGARGFFLFGIGDQQRGLAVLHAQPDAVGPEQREQRHRDRAALDDAKHRGVEGARGFEHDRHALAGPHALGFKPVRETRRVLRQFGISDDLFAALGLQHDQRIAPRCRVAVDAFMGNVQ